VRRIATDLRPMMLDDLGLVPTLEWLTNDFAGRTGVHIDLHIPDENLGVSGDAATAILRIVQEALTHVARHSGASKVAVEVIPSGGAVVVRVRDDGISNQTASACDSAALISEISAY
jgi:signal transduction histidine kinase